MGSELVVYWQRTSVAVDARVIGILRGSLAGTVIIQGPADRGEHRQAAGAGAEAITRSAKKGPRRALQPSPGS